MLLNHRSLAAASFLQLCLLVNSPILASKITPYLCCSDYSYKSTFVVKLLLLVVYGSLTRGLNQCLKWVKPQAIVLVSPLTFCSSPACFWMFLFHHPQVLESRIHNFAYIVSKFVIIPYFDLKSVDYRNFWHLKVSICFLISVLL